jgi:hypothetical protein
MNSTPSNKRARFLEGNVTPTHGPETPFFGPGFRYRFLEGGN